MRGYRSRKFRGRRRRTSRGRGRRLNSYKVSRGGVRL